MRIYDFRLVIIHGGLNKYKYGLEIYRNFGSNSNEYVSSIMYYGLFALVSSPDLFDEANLPELKEVNKLHNEAFFQGFTVLKQKSVSKSVIFDEKFE